MLWGFFGNLIFAIIARILCGNHLNIICFQVPDYLEVIDEPMDLTTIMQKIDCHQYSTCEQYLADVDLITSNALKYNPDRDPMDKLIRHRACELSDMAHSEIKSQLEPEFEKVRVVTLIFLLAQTHIMFPLIYFSAS